MGWYTTRWVRAVNRDEAKASALEVLKLEAPLKDVPSGGGAKISWEEIDEIEAAEVPKKQGGFTFFRMEDQART